MSSSTKMEARLLAAIAESKSLDEQARLMERLEEHRASVRQSRKEERELDLGAQITEPAFTAVRTFERNTHETDWLAQTAAGTEADEQAARRKARAEAMMWKPTVAGLRQIDEGEYREQAKGKARHVASSFGPHREAAIEEFLKAAGVDKQGVMVDGEEYDYNGYVIEVNEHVDPEFDGDGYWAVVKGPGGVGDFDIVHETDEAEYPEDARADAEDWIDSKTGSRQAAKGSRAERTLRELFRQAAEGQTCSVCGDKIAKDPDSENPSTWHHDNGEKHDHEAKPGGSEKESRRKVAMPSDMTVKYITEQDIRDNGDRYPIPSLINESGSWKVIHGATGAEWLGRGTEDQAIAEIFKRVRHNREQGYVPDEPYTLHVLSPEGTTAKREGTYYPANPGDWSDADWAMYEMEEAASDPDMPECDRCGFQTYDLLPSMSKKGQYICMGCAKREDKEMRGWASKRESNVDRNARMKHLLAADFPQRDGPSDDLVPGTMPSSNPDGPPESDEDADQSGHAQSGEGESPHVDPLNDNRGNRPAFPEQFDGGAEQTVNEVTSRQRRDAGNTEKWKPFSFYVVDAETYKTKAGPFSTAEDAAAEANPQTDAVIYHLEAGYSSTYQTEGARQRRDAGKDVEVPGPPRTCDICQEREAKFDGKTVMGPWANMCSICFGQYGVGLGTGKGQKLIYTSRRRKQAVNGWVKRLEDDLGGRFRFKASAIESYPPLQTIALDRPGAGYDTVAMLIVGPDSFNVSAFSGQGDGVTVSSWGEAMDALAGILSSEGLSKSARRRRTAGHWKVKVETEDGTKTVTVDLPEDAPIIDVDDEAWDKVDNPVETLSHDYVKESRRRQARDTQECPNCGKTNAASANRCGKGGSGGCGAVLPTDEKWGSRRAQRRTARALYQIAEDIESEWGNVNYAARPYLDAMHNLDSINDKFFADDASSIVAYFLSNARAFRGERAKELKDELKALLGR